MFTDGHRLIKLEYKFPTGTYLLQNNTFDICRHITSSGFLSGSESLAISSMASEPRIMLTMTLHINVSARV